MMRKRLLGTITSELRTNRNVTTGAFYEEAIFRSSRRHGAIRTRIGLSRVPRFGASGLWAGVLSQPWQHNELLQRPLA